MNFNYLITKPLQPVHSIVSNIFNSVKQKRHDSAKGGSTPRLPHRTKDIELSELNSNSTKLLTGQYKCSVEMVLSLPFFYTVPVRSVKLEFVLQNLYKQQLLIEALAFLIG